MWTVVFKWRFFLRSLLMAIAGTVSFPKREQRDIWAFRVRDNASYVVGEGEISSLAPKKTSDVKEVVAAQSRLRNLREMKLASTLLLVALWAAAVEGFRFAHFPITIDTDFLIVGKPSTVTCNYVKKRVEKVREITWFAGYFYLLHIFACIKDALRNFSFNLSLKTQIQWNEDEILQLQLGHQCEGGLWHLGEGWQRECHSEPAFRHPARVPQVWPHYCSPSTF